jgi:hypothetical protein
MIGHTLEQSCTILETTQDKYGDEVQQSVKVANCRFRWITELENPSNREEIRSDALLWLSPDEPVSEGSIILFGSDYFRVRRITQARRLRGETVYFLKCLLDKYAKGISAS